MFCWLLFCELKYPEEMSPCVQFAINALGFWFWKVLPHLKNICSWRFYILWNKTNENTSRSFSDPNWWRIMDAAPSTLKRESGRFVLSPKLFPSDFSKLYRFLPPITLCPVFLFLEKIYVSLYPCQDTERSFMPGLDCLFPEKINLDLTDGMVGWSGLGGWSDLVKDGMIWSRIGRMIWSGMVGWYGKGWEFSEKILSSG